MWILHKGDRRRIIRSTAWDEINLSGDSIVYIKNKKTHKMKFDNELEATQAFGYLLEAIRRGDRLVHL